MMLKFLHNDSSITTTSCKSTWDTVPYFGLNGLSMILCLWPPLHPFTRPCSKLGGTTLNGGRREVSILSHRPVTSSDLKQDRLSFCESVSTFLQLIVAHFIQTSYTTWTWTSLNIVWMIFMLSASERAWLVVCNWHEF